MHTHTHSVTVKIYNIISVVRVVFSLSEKHETRKLPNLIVIDGYIERTLWARMLGSISIWYAQYTLHSVCLYTNKPPKFEDKKKLHKSVIIDRCEVSADASTESLPNHNHHLENMLVFF